MGNLSQNSASQNIWAAYKTLKKQTQVIRCGYSLFGVYGHIDGGFDVARSESDLEHAAGVQEILTGVSRYYPEIIPASERYQYLDLARIHDIGENEISDLPDDGTQDVKSKHQLEKQVVLEYSNLLPKTERLNLLTFFLEFQERTTHRGKVMYLADKLEAVLQGILYEAEGRPGDLKNYPQDIGYTPSKQDVKIVETIGKTSLVDMWAYHFYKISYDYTEEKEAFLNILYCAVMDVRGEWFAWWPEQNT